MRAADLAAVQEQRTAEVMLIVVRIVKQRTANSRNSDLALRFYLHHRMLRAVVRQPARDSMSLHNIN